MVDVTDLLQFGAYTEYFGISPIYFSAITDELQINQQEIRPVHGFL